MNQNYRRQWRFYKTEQGNSPVKDFLTTLTEEDAAEVVAEMRYIAKSGLKAARHLASEIYEVRVSGENKIYRILFANLGRYSQILLALEGFNKKTQKTPPAKIEIAKKRLNNWIKRGENQKK